jgi:hypothetical protein
VLLTVGLGGCSLGNVISAHGVDYNVTVEGASNALLVLNVLRARDNAPLYFTTLPQIRGSLSVGGTFGLDLHSNPNPSALNVATLGAAAGVNPSFDVATLDTREFTRGILEPLEIGLFKYFWERDFPEQMLFYLLVSRVERVGPGAGRQVINNDPRARRVQSDEAIDRCMTEVISGRFEDAPPCDRFRDIVEAITRSGRVRFNAYTQLRPIGPSIAAGDVGTKPDVIARLGQADMRLVRVGERYQFHHATEEVAICEARDRPRALEADEATRRAGLGTPPDSREPNRFRLFSVTRTHRHPAPPARTGRGQPVGQRHDPCHHSEIVVDPDVAAEPEAGANDFRVYLRSVDEVFTYLGAVVRRQEEDGIPIDFVPDPRQEPHPRQRPHLFMLRREGAGDPRFSVLYRNSRHFVGSQTRTDYTLQVLALLARLLNVHKAATDIPTTRAVQLVR